LDHQLKEHFVIIILFAGSLLKLVSPHHTMSPLWNSREESELISSRSWRV